MSQTAQSPVNMPSARVSLPNMPSARVSLPKATESGFAASRGEYENTIREYSYSFDNQRRWRQGKFGWRDRLWPREAGRTIGYKLSRGKGGLLAGLRHGHPVYRGLSGILAWRSVLMTGLGHGDPAHRCLSGSIAEPL